MPIADINIFNLNKFLLKSLLLPFALSIVAILIILFLAKLELLFAGSGLAGPILFSALATGLIITFFGGGFILFSIKLFKTINFYRQQYDLSQIVSKLKNHLIYVRFVTFFTFIFVVFQLLFYLYFIVFVAGPVLLGNSKIINSLEKDNSRIGYETEKELFENYFKLINANKRVEAARLFEEGIDKEEVSNSVNNAITQKQFTGKFNARNFSEFSCSKEKTNNYYYVEISGDKEGSTSIYVMHDGERKLWYMSTELKGLRAKRCQIPKLPDLEM